MKLAVTKATVTRDTIVAHADIVSGGKRVSMEFAVTYQDDARVKQVELLVNAIAKDRLDAALERIESRTPLTTVYPLVSSGQFDCGLTDSVIG